jgi:hypothetical protein
MQEKRQPEGGFQEYGSLPPPYNSQNRREKRTTVSVVEARGVCKLLSSIADWATWLDLVAPAVVIGLQANMGRKGSGFQRL